MKEVLLSSTGRYYLLKDLDRNNKLIEVVSLMSGKILSLNEKVRLGKNEARIVKIRQDPDDRLIGVSTSEGITYVRPSEVKDLYEAR